MLCQFSLNVFIANIKQGVGPQVFPTLVTTVLCQDCRMPVYRLTKIRTDFLIDFLLTVKAATLIFISGRDSVISSAEQGKSGSVYNLVKN